MNRHQPPKVSVNMPCYNGAAYIAEAIESVLGQTLADFELVIVNDGSTDESVQIIESFTDPRIRLVHNEKNLGIVATRNRGLQESQGEYIAILDCDDIALPTRLAEQAAFLDENPSFGLVGSWMDVIDEHCEVLDRFQPALSPEDLVPALLFMNWFAQSSVMLRRSMLPAERYRGVFPLAEDYDLWARIAAHHKIWNVPSVLVRYRWHAENTSNADLDALNSYALGVQMEQVKRLGLSPSDAEAARHWAISNPHGWEKSIETLKETEAWLLKLVQANVRTGTFERAPFARTVARYWVAACQEHLSLGPKAQAICSASLLGQLQENQVGSRTRFLVYYVLGWMPGGSWVILVIRKTLGAVRAGRNAVLLAAKTLLRRH